MSRNKSYFNALLEFIDDEQGRAHSYRWALKRLYTVEFYSTVPNDDNRESDGRDLREYEEFAKCDDIPDGPARVIEVMIGLAVRMEYELSGYKDEPSKIDCFWDMFENLGLDGYPDQFLSGEEGAWIDEIITKFLDRDYDNFGRGGLFPLKSEKILDGLDAFWTVEDQRGVEIWYQMQTYVEQNYEI